MSPIVSMETKKNSGYRIVTGVSFAKQNQTFYWKISEGILLQNGEVQSKMDNWVPVTEFNLTDVHDGYDYHTLTWENRSIVLDTIIVPKGSVITGVRFKMHVGQLHFEVQATKFDFRTGKLYDSFEWISTPNGQREVIFLENVDVPENNADFSQPKWQNGFLVEFQPTGIAEDLAQTTVPYVDIQSVEPDHPAPLAGIGIYYKGNDGYGGFIAPYLITYDYFDHIEKSRK